MEKRNNIEIKRKAGSLRNFFAVFLVMCFIMQDLLQMYIGVFQYLDEIVATLLVFWYLLKCLTTNRLMLKQEFNILALVCGITLVGLVGNLTSNIERSVFAIVMDVGITFKFVFVYLGALCFTSKKLSDNAIRAMAIFSKFYSLILLLFALINFVTDIGMTYEIRYGMRAFAFIYNIPGTVINHCTYMLVILMADRWRNHNKNLWFIGANLVVILSTLRTRGFGLVFVFCILYYLILIAKKVKIKSYFVLIAVVLWIIGASQLETYFISNDDAPRALFLSTSLNLMRDYFPIGAGFATFGSYAAAVFYSPLYYTLGFNTRYGMGANENSFLSDNYWPTIFAQFGMVGTLLFCVLLFAYFNNMAKYILKGKTLESKLIFWFVTMDVLLSSIQSSYISHYSMVALIFITVICFREPSSDQDNSRLHRKEKYGYRT